MEHGTEMIPSPPVIQYRKEEKHCRRQNLKRFQFLVHKPFPIRPRIKINTFHAICQAQGLQKKLPAPILGKM